MPAGCEGWVVFGSLARRIAGFGTSWGNQGTIPCVHAGLVTFAKELPFPRHSTRTIFIDDVSTQPRDDKGCDLRKSKNKTPCGTPWPDPLLAHCSHSREHLLTPPKADRSRSESHPRKPPPRKVYTTRCSRKTSVFVAEIALVQSNILVPTLQLRNSQKKKKWRCYCVAASLHACEHHARLSIFNEPP